MAVCNLFGNLSNPSGNFLMFSQYVEDMTKNNVVCDNWKVVPSKYIALNVDFSNLTGVKFGNDSLNDAIPKYFQNYFENACAVGRTLDNWTPEKSSNLFWNSMFDAKFVTASNETVGSKSFINEIMYSDNIIMNAYNEHQGMGYGEIYCYIPTNSTRKKHEVEKITTDQMYYTYDKDYLVGTTIEIGNYSKEYYFDAKYNTPFNDDLTITNGNENKYNINTIVVLYDILCKENGDWNTIYSNIPMGIYFTGNFDSTGNFTNAITKYVSNSYGTGTSYGLRICTRFITTPNSINNSTNNGILIETIPDDSNFNYCQMMTAINENLSKMLEISKAAIDNLENVKDTLAFIKNNRTNVPYLKHINGKDCWFVNGRYINTIELEEYVKFTDVDYADNTEILNKLS